jgi:hypothetical protein
MEMVHNLANACRKTEGEAVSLTGAKTMKARNLPSRRRSLAFRMNVGAR